MSVLNIIHKEPIKMPEFSVFQAGNLGNKQFERVFTQLIDQTLAQNGLYLDGKKLTWRQLPVLKNRNIYDEIKRAYTTDNPIGAIQATYDDLKTKVEEFLNRVYLRRTGKEVK